MSDKTAIGNRMKFYESQYQIKVQPSLPYVARLDGMTFSSWTRGLKRPFDERLTQVMRDATKFLVEQCNGEAVMGYTQSDEISLVFREGAFENMWWSGRVDKISTFLASTLTYYFNTFHNIEEKKGKMARFDCRVFQVPSRQEAVNAILWREQDAIKNSISSLAQANFSHKALQNKNGSEMQDMLMLKKGINWNNLEPKHKRGSYLQRRKTLKSFSPEELEKLPKKHEARQNPDHKYLRSEVVFLDMPILSKVTNRVEVFFDSQEPMTSED